MIFPFACSNAFLFVYGKGSIPPGSRSLSTLQSLRLMGSWDPRISLAYCFNSIVLRFTHLKPQVPLVNNLTPYGTLSVWNKAVKSARNVELACEIATLSRRGLRCVLQGDLISTLQLWKHVRLSSHNLTKSVEILFGNKKKKSPWNGYFCFMWLSLVIRNGKIHVSGYARKFRLVGRRWPSRCGYHFLVWLMSGISS